MFGIGDIVGGVAGIFGADDAQESQEEASRDAMKKQEAMYNEAKGYHQPYQTAGLSALSGMQDKDFSRDFTSADFDKDPGYDFRMNEGAKALERSAAARGGLQSGGTMKALSRFGQDYASNEYGNAYNRFNADRDRRFGRLSNIAGMGQNAAGALSGISQNYGNNYSNLAMGIGDSHAAKSMAQAGAFGKIGNGIGQLASDTMTPGLSGLGGGGGGGGQANWQSLSETGLAGGGAYGGGRTVGLFGRK